MLPAASGSKTWVPIEVAAIIARVKGSRASVFQIGALKLRVVRDADDSTEAKLYYEQDDEWVLAGVAIAQGNCWTGSRVRFCAQ